MAGIDKAAIVFSIAITLIGVGVAVVGDSADNSPVAKTTAPKVTAQPSETKAQPDPFKDLADKVKAEAPKATEEKMEMKDSVKTEVKTEKPMVTGPKTHTVDIPVGTSVPGCEESNACYTPADIKVKAGDTVKWINIDTAAHTVTGGSPANGPSGVFDSSLVMANADYAFTFEKTGSYKYFCMVHPWMVGSVSVS